MARTKYADIIVVHRYMDEIVTLIQGIVKYESIAIVLACEVFEDHQKRDKEQPFVLEDIRAQWLQLKAENLANRYVKHETKESIKAKAIRAALHNCP